MKDIQQRVQQRAIKLWEQAGRPTGGRDAYIDRATELVAIEDGQNKTTKPLAPSERSGPENEQIAASVGPEGEPVEPIEAMENLGEFPTLTDQAEGQNAPRRPAGRKKMAPKRKTKRRAQKQKSGPRSRKPNARSAKKAKSRKNAPAARRTGKSRKTAAARNTATPRKSKTPRRATRNR